MYITGRKIIKDMIIIKEGEELIINDATLLFKKNAGIFCEGRFIAINSTFKPKNNNWNNVSIIGKTRSIIKNCKFIKGSGIKIKHIKDKFISRYYPYIEDFEITEHWSEDYTVDDVKYFYERKIGGALLCMNTEVKNCYFLDCCAEDGGSIYATFNCEISHCLFENSYAKDSAGAVYLYNANIKNSKFLNCVAKTHGGALTLDECANVKYCYFINCKSIHAPGGAIEARDMNSIIKCLFKSCTNNAVSGEFHIRDSKFNHCKDAIDLNDGSVDYCKFYKCEISEDDFSIYTSKSIIKDYIFNDGLSICKDIKDEHNYKSKTIGIAIGKSDEKNSACKAMKYAIKSLSDENIFLENATGILIHFRTNPNYEIENIGKAMEIVFEDVSEDVGLTFDNFYNNDFSLQYIEITIVIINFKGVKHEGN